MFRRLLPGWISPLLALAFLCGMPTVSMGGAESSVRSWSVGTTASPVIRDHLPQSNPDAVIGRISDEDTTSDEPIVGPVSDIDWPIPPRTSTILQAGLIAGPTHDPCAAPPRAPPAA